MSGIWGKHRGHIPLNGSSDSQVIGRGGCDKGLLGHACACARVLMCMLGCLSDLAVVGLRRKHSLLQWQEQGQFSASLSVPPSLLPVSRCLKAEGETLYAVEGFGHFSAESREQGSGEKCSSTAGLVPPRSPFLVRHALAAASWALTERQGCGACSGKRRW